MHISGIISHKGQKKVSYLTSTSHGSPGIAILMSHSFIHPCYLPCMHLSIIFIMIVLSPSEFTLSSWFDMASTIGIPIFLPSGALFLTRFQDMLFGLYTPQRFDCWRIKTLPIHWLLPYVISTISQLWIGNTYKSWKLSSQVLFYFPFEEIHRQQNTSWLWFF